MKKLFVVSILLLSMIANAQFVYQSFDHCAQDTFFRHPLVHTGLGTGSSELILSDETGTPAPYQGTGSLKVQWKVHSTETWGGFAQMMHLQKATDSIFIDLSPANELRLSYYVATPSTQAGLVNLRFKLHESGGAANYWGNQADHEDWYFEKAGVYDDTPGWKTLIIPLVDKGAGAPTDQGFSLPGWSGVANDGALNFDKVIGYSIEFTTPTIPNNGIATGVIFFDALKIFGNRYPALATFDSAAVNSFFIKDMMSWHPDTAQSKLTFTDETNPAFEGYSTLKVDYKVNTPETWGGYANFRHEAPAGTFLQDLSANTTLNVFIKVLTPATGTPDRLTLRVLLSDNLGEGEQWYSLAPVNLYQTSDWQMIKIPLVSLQGQGDMNKLRTNGFIVPAWETLRNGLFDLNKLNFLKFELSATGDFGPRWEKISGSFLIDLCVPSGYRETDNTPPVPPAGITGTPSTFVNIVTWQDVPGETQEKYNVYYSKTPINDVTAAGVEVVAQNVGEGIQVVEHTLRAPLTNQNTTYYYAITCMDKAGNVSQPGKIGSAVTNMAKGVVTISKVGPTNFVADGNLAEWAGITPIVMKPSDGSGFVVTNTSITGDADLTVKAYVALDAQNLYVAFNVDDDVFSFNPSLASYLNDAPDLFLGFYNWHGAPHGAYQRGASPDYHFRFDKRKILIDGLLDSLIAVGTANYYFDEKATPGYIIEARIPLQMLADRTGDAFFNWKEGFRIPIDFSVNDADGTGTREGIMCYSPLNEDQSWSTTSRWSYTWIGSLWEPTAVDANDVEQMDYQLAQNYPNPFNPATKISYSLRTAGHVSLKVYDVMGREVATLVNEIQTAGNHAVNFNAARISSGVYFYTVSSGSFKETKKMVLIR